MHSTWSDKERAWLLETRAGARLPRAKVAWVRQWGVPRSCRQWEARPALHPVGVTLPATGRTNGRGNKPGGRALLRKRRSLHYSRGFSLNYGSLRETERNVRIEWPFSKCYVWCSYLTNIYVTFTIYQALFWGLRNINVFNHHTKPIRSEWLSSLYYG